MKEWTLISKLQEYKCVPFTVYSKQYQKPDDQGNFTGYVLESPHWVNIIPETPDGKIVLIKQFRFGTDRIELEIPGGCIDPNEAPNDAAKRELEEETGFRAKKFTQIGVVDANPAIQMNKCYTFLAEGAEPVGQQHWDPDEIIEYELAAPNEVRQFIRMGNITNTYIIAAFHWLALHRELK
jgi:8-oxo-dGTP pyrophosphatase MutT (NUDIX family)